MALLREMHARWPFFASVLSNMAMVLSKTDLAVASRYTRTGARRGAAGGGLRASADEHRRTLAALAGINGHAQPLDDNPTLAREPPQPGSPTSTRWNHLQVEPPDALPRRAD